MDSSLADILSITTGQLAGGVWQGNLNNVLTTIRPFLAQELTQYGINKLGNSIGLDPRISSLIGSPVAGLVGNAFGPNPATAGVLASVAEGIKRGTISLGLSYALDRSGLDPLLGGLTARAVTGAIEASLSGKSLFQGIYESFTSSALNIARLGISGTDAIAQAQYLQRVTNIADIIRTKGLKEAIASTVTQVLHEDTISSILKSYSSVQSFIQDSINKNKIVTTVDKGKSVKRLYFEDATLSSDYVDFDPFSEDVVGIKTGNKILRGAFGVDEHGSFGLKTGDIEEVLPEFDSYTQFQNIKDGKQTYAVIRNTSGDTLLAIEPAAGKSYNVYDLMGDFGEVRLTSQMLGIAYDISNGEVTKLMQYDVNSSSTNPKILFAVTSDGIEIADGASLAGSYLPSGTPQKPIFDTHLLSSNRTYLRDSMEQLFGDNAGYESTKWNEVTSILEKKSNLLLGALKDQAQKAVLGALDKLDSSLKIADRAKLMALLIPAKPESGVTLYDYERTRMNLVFEDIDSLLAGAKSIDSVQYNRVDITPQESATRNQEFQDISKAFGFIQGAVVRMTPIMSTGISLGSKIATDSFTQPYNSSQAEYKFDISYTAEDNSQRQLVVGMRTSNFTDSNVTHQGVVQVVVVQKRINPQTQEQEVVSMQVVPGPWIEN